MSAVAAAIVLPQEKTALALVEDAINELSTVGEGIATLKTRYEGVVFDLATTVGLRDAKAARIAIREPRYLVEKIRKEAKAPLLKLGKQLDSEAERITNALLALEEPIDKQIKAVEEEAERQRQETIRLEQARVERIRKQIAAVHGLPLLAVGKNAVQIAALVRDLDEVLLKNFDFQEFAADASVATDFARQGLQQALDARVKADEEAERLRAEREQLDKQKREQDARDRAALEEVEKRRREQDERELALKFEEQRLVRQREQSEQEEKNRQLRGMLERMPLVTAPYTPVQVEADDAPLQVESLEQPQSRGVSMRPTEEEIIVAVAMHFRIDRVTSLAWLRDCEFSEVL